MKPAESDHLVRTLHQVGGSAGSRTFVAVKHTGHLRTAGMVTSEASVGMFQFGENGGESLSFTFSVSAGRSH